MSDHFSELCERIRQHCQQQQWYGPDGYKLRYEPGYYDADQIWHDGETPASGHYDLNGKWYAQNERIFDHRGFLDENGKLQCRPIMHDLRSGFEFPPATEEQVQVTQEALALPLLPVMRALYTQVANGGFGPACGITGIRGGYCFGGDGNYWTMDRYTDTNPSMEYVEMGGILSRLAYPYTFELLPHQWPAHFLHFCYAGCGEDVLVDGKSGQVFLVGAGDPVQGGYTQFFRRLDLSLENWLDRWLRGKKGLFR